MKPNDLVRQKSNPHGFPHGFILSIENDMAKVYGLSIVSGEWTGTRNIPLSDLELDRSKELFRAYYINRNANRKRNQIEELLAKRYSELIAKTAKRHGVTPETAEAIFEDIRRHQDVIPSIMEEGSRLPAADMLVTVNPKGYDKITDVQPLWNTNYYDGPLTGIALYFGSKCMYELWIDEDGERIYALLRLTPEQLAEEERWHALFEEHVGNNSNHGIMESALGTVKPEAGWTKFYEPYKREYKPPMFLDSDIVGWFDDEAFLDNQHHKIG